MMESQEYSQFIIKNVLPKSQFQSEADEKMMKRYFNSVSYLFKDFTPDDPILTKKVLYRKNLVPTTRIVNMGNHLVN